MMEQDQTNQNFPSQDDSINLKELFAFLWGGKKLIIIITSVFALCSILYALSLPNHYKSEAVLTLADGPNETGVLARYSGLASIAGISMPSGSRDKGAVIMNTIMSRGFLKHLLSFENVLPSLVAAKSYDSESKKVVFDPDIYDTANKKWLQAQPSYIKAYDDYREQMSIKYDANDGIMGISVEHKSPIFAKELLDLIIREADALTRQKDLTQSSDALEYLVSEISKTSLIEMKSSINQLIQSQLETQMMAKISTDYALMVIEPPFIPEKKSKPSRSLISFFGTMLGFAFGILWILMRHYYGLTKIKQSL